MTGYRKRNFLGIITYKGVLLTDDVYRISNDADFLFVIIALQKIVKTLCIDRIAVNDISFFANGLKTLPDSKSKNRMTEP